MENEGYEATEGEEKRKGGEGGEEAASLSSPLLSLRRRFLPRLPSSPSLDYVGLGKKKDNLVQIHQR